jgi:hypothetical protein
MSRVRSASDFFDHDDLDTEVNLIGDTQVIAGNDHHSKSGAAAIVRSTCLRVSWRLKTSKKTQNPNSPFCNFGTYARG